MKIVLNKILLCFFLFVSVKNFAQKQIDSLQSVLKNTISVKQKAHLKFILADKYADNNISDKAFKYLSEAKEHFTEIKHIDSLMLCNLKLFNIVDSRTELKSIDALTYLDEYKNYAYKTDDTKKIIQVNKKYASYYFTPKDFLKAKKHYFIALDQAKKITDSTNLVNIYSNLGLLYSGFIRQDSARYYFDKALKLNTKKNPRGIFGAYFNYANSYQKEGKYKEAITYLKKAEKLKLDKHKLRYTQLLNNKLAVCYSKINDYKNAYQYIKKATILKDSLNLTKQNIAIADIQTKYESEKKENEILQQQVTIKNNRVLIFSISSLLLIALITGYGMYTNAVKKHQLAEKNNLIEQQKVANLLKEQEIIGINAMIDGQEKERKRIAQDLHDDIGGTLATLKLHLENFNLNRHKEDFSEEKMLKLVRGILDDAYLKVRSMAHAKNAGVIANQGLLVAVKTLAEKVSSANKMNIEVTSFGLNRRIDSTTEITVFRIIQELITNMIKHANATKGSIQVNAFDDNLNLMVEDNGIGFDYDTVEDNSSMGLQSIKTRVEHLNGVFKIDSNVGNGSTFIIDIPL